jgi:NAD+ kinase
MMSPIRRVGLVAKPGLTEAADLLGDIGAWLAARGIEPCYETETADLVRQPLTGCVRNAEQIGRDEQVVVVLGGDGTLAGPAHVEPRLMLEAVVRRADGTTLPHISLNDVVITKGALSRMIDLVASADGQLIARFKADGLIVASPTGSTAYNLSAGGPIVHPGVDALVLTPIAPHTLTNRPVVLPAAVALEIAVAGEAARSSREEIFVTFDGQVGDILGPGDNVAIHRSPYTLRLLKPSSHAYFQVLRQKLRWAER